MIKPKPSSRLCWLKTYRNSGLALIQLQLINLIEGDLLLGIHLYDL
jgi:hypothetical protein